MSNKKKWKPIEWFGQNNSKIYEFLLHLGKNEEDVKYKFVNLGYPVINIIAKLKIN